MLSKRALVRRPGPLLAEGIVTHIDRSPIDLTLARRQWYDYRDALHAAGWETIEVPPADDCPDAVFVEDTAVMYGDLAVIARIGTEARRPESRATEAVLTQLGYQIRQLSQEATLDGGDVLKHAGQVWVGQGGRTNEAGLRELREALAPWGAEVVGVPLRSVLHLKSAVTALPDGRILGYLPLVDEPLVWGDSLFPVPEASGAHVVLLGGDRVLMAASAPHTAAILRSEGFDVTTVDISEYEKLEGCVTCLSVRLRQKPLAGAS